MEDCALVSLRWEEGADACCLQFRTTKTNIHDELFMRSNPSYLINVRVRAKSAGAYLSWSRAAPPSVGVHQLVDLFLHSLRPHLYEQDPLPRQYRQGEWLSVPRESLLIRERSGLPMLDASSLAQQAASSRSGTASRSTLRRSSRSAPFTSHLTPSHLPVGSRYGRASDGMVDFGAVAHLGGQQRRDQVLPAQHEQPPGLPRTPGEHSRHHVEPERRKVRDGERRWDDQVVEL